MSAAADGGDALPSEVDGDDAPLRRLTVTFSIDLHPSRTLNHTEAVHDELNSRLMRYDERLDGVMLAYNHEKHLSPTGRVLDICPFVNVHVQARVLLFRPRVGARLVGRVNLVGADHVSVLVLNMFNVAIGRDNIRPDLRFVDTAFGGEDRARVESATHPGHVITSGVDVAFTVVGITDVDELLSMTGAMQTDDTGSVAFLRQLERARQQGVRVSQVGEDDDDAEERRRRKRERKAAKKAAAAAAAAAVAAAPADAVDAEDSDMHAHQDAPRHNAHGKKRKHNSGADQNGDVPAEVERKKHKHKYKDKDKEHKKHKKHKNRHRDD